MNDEALLLCLDFDDPPLSLIVIQLAQQKNLFFLFSIFVYI